MEAPSPSSSGPSCSLHKLHSRIPPLPFPPTATPVKRGLTRAWGTPVCWLARRLQFFMAAVAPMPDVGPHACKSWWGEGAGDASNAWRLLLAPGSLGEKRAHLINSKRSSASILLSWSCMHVRGRFRRGHVGGVCRWAHGWPLASREKFTWDADG